MAGEQLTFWQRLTGQGVDRSLKPNGRHRQRKNEFVVSVVERKRNSARTPRVKTRPEDARNPSGDN